MRKTFFSLLLALITICSTAQSPDFEWASSIGGPGIDFGDDVATDAAGNVYALGGFRDTVDFDPGLSTYNLISQGDEDVYVQKLDGNGNLIWVVSFGGTGSDRAAKLSFDMLGNVYITGAFSNTVDFDPGAGTFNLAANGGLDCFVLKLDSSGSFVWAKSIGGSGHDGASCIDSDALGNVYLTGKFSDTVDFDPGAAIFNLSGGNYDVFTLKLDAGGNFIWANHLENTMIVSPNSLAVSDSGDVCITGRFQGTVDFDPSAATLNLVSNGSSDGFLLKLNTDGNLLWAKAWGGSGSYSVIDIALDDLENSIVTGYYQATGDFDPGAAIFNLSSNGGYDCFVQKLDPQGDFLWATSTGGPIWDQCRGVCTDHAGNIYLTGLFRDSVDFDPGTSSTFLSTTAYAALFVQKLDSNGNFLWAEAIEGDSTSSQALGESIAVDNFGSVYATGSFSYTVDFDHTVSNFDLTTHGSFDAFILKLSQCLPSITIDLISSCGPIVWIDGIAYTSSNDSATYILVNAAGCDSIIALDLTIAEPNYGIDIQTACDSFTWIDGVIYTTSDSTATDTLINMSGCDSIVTLNLSIITVNSSVTSNAATLTADALGATYQWIDCSDMIPINGETNQAFTATWNGDFAVIVTDSNCSDTSDCQNVTGIGVASLHETTQLMLYPNPNDGNFTIQHELLLDNANLYIVDLTGKIVFTQMHMTTKLVTFDVTTLSPGLYVVRIETAEQSLIRKFVIERDK
jgi:hypothetical protein